MLNDGDTSAPFFAFFCVPIVVVKRPALGPRPFLVFRSSDPIGPAWVAHSGALSVRDMISPMMPRRVCKKWWGGKMVVMW